MPPAHTWEAGRAAALLTGSFSLTKQSAKWDEIGF